MVNASRRRSTSERSDSEEEPNSAKRVKIERQSLPSRRRVSPDASPSQDDGDGRAEEDEDMSSEGEELNEESITDEAAMKAHLAERARNRGKKYEGSASEAGIIKQVNLVDFMCHKHLTVDFGAKMNFLVGHNGSGKSAILTAIAIALGGKAAATGRGSGMKDLIRREADRAIIILTLSNEGHNAYRPKDKDYSPNIIIERIIHKSGTSEWKFRAQKDGKILGKKKSELDAICGTFSLDVDQPLTILTQDQARSFLQNADETQLYKFFMRGSILSDLKTTYDTTEQMIMSIENTAKQMQRNAPELEDNMKRLKRKLDASGRISDQKNQLGRLRDELGWALVTAKEKDRDVYQAEMDELDGKMVKVDDLILEDERELKPMEHELSQQEEAIKTYADSRQPIEAERKVAKADHDELQKQFDELNAEIKGKQQAVARSEAEIQDLDRKITAKKKQLDRGRDQAQIDLELELAKYEDLEHKLTRDLPRKEAAVEDARTARDTAEKRHDDSKKQANILNDEIQRLRTSATNLENQRGNRLAAFGHNIQAVLGEIDKARWHVAKPVGPLGRYVQLKDGEFQYKNVMESLLGNMMCSFAVQDSRDKNQLQKILIDCNKNRGYKSGTGGNGFPTIIVNTNDMFDFSAGDYSNHGETVISKLNITDEYVLRVMVNTANIEKLFVSPDMDRANAEIDRLVPAIGRAIIYSARDFYKQEGYRGGKSGGPMNRWHGNPMFTKDVASDLNEVKAKLDAKMAEREVIDVQSARLRDERDNVQRTLSDVEKEVKKIRDSLPKIADKIAGFRSSLNERPSDEITAFEGLKREYNNARMRDQIHLDGLLVEQTAHSERLAAAKAKFQELARKLEDFAPERNRKQTRLYQLTEARAQKKNSISYRKNQKKMYQEKRDAAQAGYDRADQFVQQWIEGIIARCPERIHTKRDIKEIEAERKVVEKAIQEAEKLQGIDVDLVREQFARATEQFEGQARKQKDLHGLANFYQSHLKKRGDWWLDMRTALCVKTRSTFVQNTSLRGFDGRLIFNHTKGTLKMTIRTAPGAESQNSQFHNMFKTPKHLSGGERSFSTVSFLLALWETCGGPLRCLDEWDVFLDQVNRTLAANMLIDGAKDADGKQYILITPQNMQGMKIENSADTKIIKMAAPERNQETLNL